MKKDYETITTMFDFDPYYQNDVKYQEHVERYMFNKLYEHIHSEKDTIPIDFSISEELTPHGRGKVARLKITIIDKEFLDELLVYRDYARNNGFVYKSRERERDDMLRKLGK
jgi:hypothetical protein